MHSFVFHEKTDLPTRSLARAVDLASKSYDLARPGVSPPLNRKSPIERLNTFITLLSSYLNILEMSEQR